MFITTKSDSIVPIGNIKAIKPNKSGCTIYLKTGEQIKDPRKHTEVLTEAYQDRIELTPIIDAINAMAGCVANHQTKVDKDIAELANVITDAISRVEVSSKELTSASVAINHAGKNTKHASKQMNQLAETLNAAIQEI